MKKIINTVTNAIEHAIQIDSQIIIHFQFDFVKVSMPFAQAQPKTNEILFKNCN